MAHFNTNSKKKETRTQSPNDVELERNAVPLVKILVSLFALYYCNPDTCFLLQEVPPVEPLSLSAFSSFLSFQG